MPSALNPRSQPVLVDVEWLADADHDIVLADVRWYLDGRSGRAAHAAGHLPGAVFVDLDTVLAAPASPAAGRHPLPDPADVAAHLGALGIGPDAHVIAYDDAGGLAAARLIWMLRAIDQPASLLDGGVQAWVAVHGEGALTTDTAPRTPATRPVIAWPGELLASADDAARAATDAVVLDARAAERFRGEVEPIDPRAGHIPGARNVPAASLVDAAGRMLAPDTLTARFAASGVTDDPSPIAYCGSGVTASHLLLALEHAGLGRGRLYAGSWSQWSHDAARPVATGSIELRPCHGAHEHPRLTSIWRSAVDATHTFLSPSDIDGYEARMCDEFLPHLELTIATIDGVPSAFMGMSGNRIEMLFVDADLHGSGLGTRLVEHAVAHTAGPVAVDVNEQNSAATAFYERVGFVQVGRSARDGDGRPFPLLHLQLTPVGAPPS